MSHFEQFQRLITESESLPHGAVPVMMLEEAVRIADVHLEIHEQLTARQHLISACFCGGKPLPLYVALTWCLSALDNNTIELDEYEILTLLWQCKHAIAYAPSFSSISYQRIQELLSDVLKRYEKAGTSPRAVYMLAGNGELFMGHVEEGKQLLEKGKACRRDQLSESAAWELFFDVEMAIAEDREEDAMQLMEPMLANPHLAQDVDPWFVNRALIPLHKRGQTAEAKAHQTRVIAKIAGNPKFVSNVGCHMSFLVLTGDASRAVQLMRRHLEMGLSASDQGSRLFFSLHSWFVIEWLARQGRKTIALRMPDLSSVAADLDLPKDEDGVVDTRAMADWLEADFLQLVEEFNNRNGNDYIGEYVQQIRERLDW